MALDLAQLARDTGAAIADADQHGAAVAASFLRLQMPAVHHALRHACVDREQVLEFGRAFGAISLAVHAIDGKGDNTAWQDVLARIEVIGKRGDCRECPHNPTPAMPGTNRYGNGG